MARWCWYLLALVASFVAFAAPAAARPGDLDPAFSGDGFAHIEFSELATSETAMRPIGLAEDGDILLGGSRTVGSPPVLHAFTQLARMNPDGTLDPTLGGDGTVDSDFGQSVPGVGPGVTPQAFAVDATGRILIAAGDRVLRVGPNGELDLSFGTQGAQAINLESAGVSAVTVDAQGRIVAGGAVDLGPTAGISDGLVVRLLADGSFDSAFGGGDGIVTMNLAPSERIDRLALDAAGRILAVGTQSTTAPFSTDLSFLRLTDVGSLDSSFGDDGSVQVDPRRDVSSSASPVGFAVDGLGRPLVAANVFPDPSNEAGREPGGRHYLARLDQQGRPDPSLGTHGLREIAFSGDAQTNAVGTGALILQSDGRIVIGGYFQGPLIFRFTPDGAPDSSFGLEGVARVYSPLGPSLSTGVIVDQTGRLVLGGATYEQHARAQVAAFRTDTNPPDDADADGVVTSSDACPALFGTPAGCPRHGRAVTIREKGSGVGGTVSSKWPDAPWDRGS